MNNLNKEKNVIFNLKKLNIKKSDSKYLANNNLLNLSISENNIKGKSNVQIKKNNFNLSNKYFLSNSNSKRNKTFNFNNNVIPRKKEKRTLSEEEKKN